MRERGDVLIIGGGTLLVPGAKASVEADHVPAALVDLAAPRSEERRGGEEGRSRWAPDP